MPQWLPLKEVWIILGRYLHFYFNLITFAKFNYLLLISHFVGFMLIGINKLKLYLLANRFVSKIKGYIHRKEIS